MESQPLQGQSILSILENPELLKAIPLEELQEWKNTFPYSANIQLLYAFRYFLKKQALSPEILESVAMRIANRQQLHYWFSQFNRYLIRDSSPEHEIGVEQISTKNKKKGKRKKRKIKEGIRWRKLVEKQQPITSPEGIRESSSPFLRWLYTLGSVDSPGYRDLEKELKKLSEKKKKSQSPIQDPKKEWIDDSLQDDKQITSEALAEILATQGHFEKAKEMYERLSLKFPEKIAFFAAKIEDLSNKITNKED